MWVIGEKNMAEKETFQEFLKWSVSNYPAEHYLLIMWDHGEGIFSNGRGTGSPGTTAADDPGQQYGTLTRGVCSDESDGGWLNLWEMEAALAEVKTQHGVVFDIIGFDICWVGTIEYVYGLAPYADYFMGSMEEEPNPGWQYSNPIGYLVDNPWTEPSALAIRVTNDFKEQYQAELYKEWRYLTYVAVDLNRFSRHMIPLINDLSDVMSERIFDEYTLIENARKNTATPLNKPFMADLFHFAKILAVDETVSIELRSAAKALLAEYNETILHFISGSKQPDAYGLTIYFPLSNYNDQYNSMITFTKEHWDEFLQLYRTPIQIKHIPLNDTESDKGEFEIRAEIKGFNLDVDNIFLFYQEINTDLKVPLVMSPTKNDHEYSAKIKITNFDTTVFYCIRTQETVTKSRYVWSPQEADEADYNTWHSFRIENDTTPPVIVHDVYRDIEGTLGEPYNFYVNITDNLGIDPESLFLYYNTNSSDFFHKIPLQLGIYPHRYNCSIPTQPAGTQVYYYFTATDQARASNSNRMPAEGHLVFNVSRIKPVAGFIVNKLEAFTYEVLNFTSTSEPEDLITTYTWDFGDGVIIKGQDKNITHQYTEPDQYTIALNVQDEYGLFSIAEVKVLINNRPPFAVIKTDPVFVNNESREIDDNNSIIDPVFEDDEIVLDCTGSFDRDGFI